MYDRNKSRNLQINGVPTACIWNSKFIVKSKVNVGRKLI